MIFMVLLAKLIKLIKLLMQVTLLVLTVSINHRTILLVLFITSWWKPLKRNPSREICPYATWLELFLPNKHPDKIYICYCSTWIFLVLWYSEVSLENKRLIYNLLFGCPKANFDLDMLKKPYMFKMVLLHPT